MPPAAPPPPRVKQSDAPLSPAGDSSSSSGSSSPAMSSTTASTSNYGAFGGIIRGQLDVESRASARSTRSRSVTTLDLEQADHSCASLTDTDQHQISLYHEIIMQHPQRALKECHQNIGDFDRNIYERDTASIVNKEQPGSNNPKQSAGSGGGGGGDGAASACCGNGGALVQPSVGKFRYVVATLIILGVTISAYASNTMYIAAIEMISNDVIQSGLTTLRAKHLSNDPLAIDKNAALPGTCPVEAVQRPIHAHQLVEALIQDQFNAIKMPNASEISAHEQWAMQQDTVALYDDVQHRLDGGQLVDWTIQQRGYVFTAHTIGTILLAVPVSRLGLMYGSKTMIFICILLAALRMAALPTIAGYAPFWATFTFELVIGGVGGNIIILGYPIAAAWLLPYEANFFVAINILSTMIGIAATNFVSTQLLTIGVNWCWCYYIPGILLFMLAIGWFVWGSDRPETSRFVSRAELELLQSNTIAKRNENLLRCHEQQNSSTGSECNANQQQSDERLPLTRKLRDVQQQQECKCSHLDRPNCPANDLKRKPNWTVIFTCPTIWALILVQFANHWTTKNATLWPTFYSNILHIDSSTIGVMLGIKGIWALIFGTIFAIVTRRLISNRPFNMSLTAYRRWNQAIATTFYAVSVTIITLMDCNILANFVALMIQPLVSSFNSISHDQMPLDLSAEDSGLLVSVIRLMSIGDIVALPVSSYILSHARDALAGDRATWKIVWSVGLAVRLVASLFFVLVAKSRPRAYSRQEPSGPCKSSQVPKNIVIIKTSDRYV